MWWSHRSSAFRDQTDIAEQFARNAGLAIHNVNARDNLAQAVIAQHRVGLAQGILMSRHGCSPDQAIAILKDRSQRTNRKLRLIADEVIRIGDLEPALTAKERIRIH
jgi:AmiR/NasT family two-component response regulator